MCEYSDVRRQGYFSGSHALCLSFCLSHLSHHAQTIAIYNVTGLLIPSNTNFLQHGAKKKHDCNVLFTTVG